MGKLKDNLRQYGLSFTFRKIVTKLFLKKKNEVRYGGIQVHYDGPDYDINEYKEKILISILVPLFNTPEKYLLDMINSVRNQTYTNWELCLCDASDGDDCEKIVKEMLTKDERIVYKRISNKGIAENTNECMKLAGGNYIGLFDHDDILHRQALEMVVQRIVEDGADFVYTDEAVFSGDDINDIINIHIKPGFSPDQLRANNYICHFTIFSRELSRQVGEMKQEFDGSQDFDYFLRLTEKARKISHVGRVLYYWRCHPQSVAADIGVKSYAIEAGRRAIEESLKREGLSGSVKSFEGAPTFYDVKYEIDEKDLDRLYRIDEGKEIDRGELDNSDFVLLKKNDSGEIDDKDILRMLTYCRRTDIGGVGCLMVRNEKILDGIRYSDYDGKMGILYKGIPASSLGYMNGLTYPKNVTFLGSGFICLKKEDYKKYIEAESEKTDKSIFDDDIWLRAYALMCKEGKYQLCLPDIKLDVGDDYKGIECIDGITDNDFSYNELFDKLGKIYYIK